MILNLGAGEKLVEGAVNVDITPGEGIDQIVDLTQFPYPWEDNSIDGIHLSHILEHFPDQVPVIKECYRILKKGGFFRVVVPHCSSLSSVGCMGHYRTYCADTLYRYLDTHSRIDQYMFRDVSFKTRYYYLNWVWEEAAVTGFLNFPKWSRPILPLINKINNKLINKSHRMFERFWWPLVGGASEVVWEGEKI
jgi:predicted SAM-dependent methyltransferase